MEYFAWPIPCWTETLGSYEQEDFEDITDVMETLRLYRTEPEKFTLVEPR